jgi:hypothetical protein
LRYIARTQRTWHRACDAVTHLEGEGRAMKKKSVAGKRGKRGAKDLAPRRAQDPKGGQLASSVQKKLSDTNNAVIGKIG